MYKVSVWHICVMTSCTNFVFWLGTCPTWRRGRSTTVWLYFRKKDNTGASCISCRALITSTCWNTWPHRSQRLLSDGSNSRWVAYGTASSVSKVPGNVKLPGSVIMLATYCTNNFHPILTFSWRGLQEWGTYLNKRTESISNIDNGTKIAKF